MSPSSFDDPFAELFGKLPDPRSRELDPSTDAARAEKAGAPQASEPAGAESSSVEAPGAGVPLSRRAAREAAARDGAAPPASPNAPAPAQTTASSAPAVLPTAPAAASETSRATSEESPASGPIGPIPFDGVFTMRAPSQPVPIIEDEPDPADAWLLAGASRAGAARAVGARTEPAASPGYARTGQMPQVGARPDPSDDVAPDLDDLFASSRGMPLDEEPAEKKRRRRRIGGWIALGVILAILGGIAAGGWYVWSTYEQQIRKVLGWEEPKDFEAGLANGEVMVTIESGDTGMPISQTLYDSGVTKTSHAFYDYLIETGQNPTFQPGVYALQYQMTSEAALEALLDPANRRENTAQIPEGFTVDGTIERLAEGTGIPLEEFQAAVADASAYGVSVDPAIVAAGGNALEGWLFPATYTFEPDATATDIIQTLVDETISRLDAAGVPVEDRQRILTLASIIQREARYEADMQKVSRVIENRLNPDNQETFGLLQMDSTAQFGYGELNAGTASTSEEAQYNDNPWNTYVYAGLPIGPISNPGDTAIAAAMNPAEGDWLYFVTVNLDTGETVFTSNINDHNRAVEQWQSWCVDNPDSGC